MTIRTSCKLCNRVGVCHHQQVKGVDLLICDPCYEVLWEGQFDYLWERRNPDDDVGTFDDIGV